MDGAQGAGPKRPGAVFDTDDLLRFDRVTAVHGVRAAPWVVWSLKTVDEENDSYLSSLWLARGDGDAAPVQLTAGTALDNQPRVSPDGAYVAFASDRAGGPPQLHLIRRAGGEARKLTSFREGVLQFGWRPDGRALWVTAEEKHGGKGPNVARRVPYKLDGIGFTADTNCHLHVVELDQPGEPRRLTHGTFEVRAACWSPDGKRLAYTRTRDGRFAHRTDLWICDAQGRNHRQASQGIASVQGLSWSPDGRWIALAGSEREGDSIARLWLHDVESGDEPRGWGDESIEVPAGALLWDEDSAGLVFLRATEGREHLAHIRREDAAVATLVGGDRHVSGVCESGGRLAFFAHDARQSMDVFVVDRDGANERRLSHINPWWDERPLPALQPVSFDVPDGDGGTERIAGWILRPRGATGPGPLLVDVHGGPASYALLAYASHAYWSVLCSRGWTILALNPVGSSSYGREFATRLKWRWGELDFPQHMAAVRKLQADGIADERVAIAGKSYGGYLSAWAVGHSRDFKAAIVAAPVADLITHFGTSDSGYYADRYVMGGPPWEARERYVRLCPLQYAHRATTPTLIVQGEDDQRCPRSESESLFTTIMTAGDTPCELAMYPGGSHHFYEDGKPSHRVDYVRRVVDWLEKHVK